MFYYSSGPSSFSVTSILKDVRITSSGLFENWTSGQLLLCRRNNRLHPRNLNPHALIRFVDVARSLGIKYTGMLLSELGLTDRLGSWNSTDGTDS